VVICCDDPRGAVGMGSVHQRPCDGRARGRFGVLEYQMNKFRHFDARIDVETANAAANN